MSFEFNSYLDEAADVVRASIHQEGQVRAMIDCVVKALGNGGTVFWAGNGGSAAESQHLSAELVGRFVKESLPFRSISLTVDTSALTAIGNDYGFDQCFSRQLQAIGRPGDVVFGFSTSGRSQNIIELFNKARSIGCTTIGFTGSDDSEVSSISDVCFRAPSTKTWHIQEAHAVVGHYICSEIEARLS